MKKIITILSITFLFLSCNKEEEIPPVTSQPVSGQIDKITYTNTDPETNIYDFIYTNNILDSVLVYYDGVLSHVYLVENDRIQRDYGVTNSGDIRYYYTNNTRLDSIQYVHDGMTVLYEYVGDTVKTSRSDMVYTGKLYPLSQNVYEYDHDDNNMDAIITTNSIISNPIFALWSWSQPFLQYDIINYENNLYTGAYNIEYSSNGYILSVVRPNSEQYVYDYY